MARILLFFSTVFVLVTEGCNEGHLPAAKTDSITDHAVTKSSVRKPASLTGIINGYLQLKNALASDNGDAAADAGKVIMKAVDEMDTAGLTAAQRKMFNDVAADLKENAEHCSKNGNRIEHQREHFEMLSQDMYDLVKAFSNSRHLFKIYCPMYNGGKGGMWLSESKEIKNPYFGTKMPECGELKEEIK